MGDRIETNDPTALEYHKLQGFTVKDVVISPASQYGPAEYGLLMEKGNERRVAWILCDPEGNGPGFLMIETPYRAGG